MLRRRIMTSQPPAALTRRVLCCLAAIAILVPLGSLYAGLYLARNIVPYKSILLDRGVIADSSQLNMSHYRSHNLSILLSVPNNAGLGAQMFQYAALYGIAKATGLNPVISTQSESSSPLIDVFPFLQASKISCARPGEKYLKYREFRSHAFDSRAFSLNYMKDIELLGEFRSWRYFDHVRAEIQQQFTFSSRAVAMVQEFLYNTRSHALNQQPPIQVNAGGHFGNDSTRFPVTYVGVHIRRGDYLSEENKKLGYQAADMRYLDAAMQMFRHKYKNVIFVVSSDDLSWCRENLVRSDTVTVFSPYTHPGLDLCLLSQCNHTIITTGAFGWWAGWLAGGTTLYYINHPKSQSELAKEFKSTDYFPTYWLPVTTT